MEEVLIRNMKVINLPNKQHSFQCLRYPLNLKKNLISKRLEKGEDTKLKKNEKSRGSVISM